MIDTKVIFFHVPKTAGTSLHSFLKHYFGDILFYPSFGPHDYSRNIAESLEDLKKKLSSCTSKKRIALLSSLNNVNVIGGHTKYELTNYINKNFYTFTSFREPIDRLISFYFHYVFPENEKHVRKYRNETRDMSIEEFLSSPLMLDEVDNVYVRYFSQCSDNRRVTLTDLELAMKNISRLNLIIYQDDVEYGMSKIKRDLCIDDNTEFVRLKVGYNRQRAIDFIDASEELYFINTRFDNILYEYSKKLSNSTFIK